MRRIASILLAAAVAGCGAPPSTPNVTASAPPPAASPYANGALPPPPVYAQSVPLPPPVVGRSVALPPPLPPDQCGARELAGLVGKPRTEIPVPVDLSKRRVICTTCPKTQDFSPERMTIQYDASTGLVTSVACE